MSFPGSAARGLHRTPARTVWAALLCCSVVACGDSPTGGGDPEPRVTSTFLSFSSEAGDVIGEGQSRRYVLADGSWSTYAPASPTGERDKITIFVANADWGYALDLAAPPGQALTAGTYESAVRVQHRAAGQPGLNVQRNGRFCDTLTGRFVIHEVVYGSGSTVDFLHATFRQHCEGSPAALNGEIAIVANPWR